MLRSAAGLAMKAVRVHQYGGPEVLQLDTDVAKPAITDTQVLIRVEYAGLNPLDTYIRSDTAVSVRKQPLPYVPSNDGAGVVANVGAHVTRFKVGDRVFSIDGGKCAEYCASEAARCWSLPSHVSFAQGAALPIPYFTAYRALFTKCGARPGQTVLIHGASGAVGIAAVQMAAAAGMRVIGTAGTKQGMMLVERVGADFAFNHRIQHYKDKIMAATENKGVDVVLEMQGHVNLAKDLEMVAQNGIICIIGSRDSVEINPRLMMGKESRIVGLMVLAASEAEWTEMGAAVEAGLRSGALNPVVGKEYGMSEVANAHVDITENAGTKGKLVIRIDH